MSTGLEYLVCYDCDNTTYGSCSHCDDVLSFEDFDDEYFYSLTFPDYNEHTCRNLILNLTDAFEGLGLGGDYQKCPNKQCGLGIQLMSSCNALLCTSSACRTSFCAIRGKKAKHDSDHWQAGKSSCPRWNKPGADNARFDEAPGGGQNQVVPARVPAAAQPQHAPAPVHIGPAPDQAALAAVGNLFGPAPAPLPQGELQVGVDAPVQAAENNHPAARVERPIVPEAERVTPQLPLPNVPLPVAAPPGIPTQQQGQLAPLPVPDLPAPRNRPAGRIHFWLWRPLFDPDLPPLIEPERPEQ